MQRPLWPAYTALVLTTALWGSNPAISRLVLDAVPPVAMALARWLVVVLALAPLVWPERAAIAQALRTRWRALLLLALLASAPQSAVVYEGLARSSAINLGLLNSAIPVLILVLAALFWGRRIRFAEAAGIAVSLAGVLVILFHGSLARVLSLALNLGDLLLFTGMVMWAFYTLKLADRPRGLSPPALVALMGGFGVLVCAPFAIAEAVWLRPAQLDGRVVLALVYIGLGPTLGAMLCYNYAVERVGAVRAGVLVHLMPLFASLFAMLLLGERVRAFHAAGFALVVGGALIALLPPSRLVSSAPIEKAHP